MITAAQLTQILPACSDPNGWSLALNSILPSFGIVSSLQWAAFIAQCATESAEFNEIVENLNYSAQALLAVFPREFTSLSMAEQYARQPEAIANIVYAPPRLGNINSTDGWYLRGRGIIQITGRTNYQNFANHLNMTLDDAVQYTTTQNGAVAAAAWYWMVNNLNNYCADDTNDFILLTRAINGSTTDLSSRETFWTTAKKVLNV